MTIFWTLWIILEWSLRVLAVFVVPRNREPNSSIIWLLIIFAFPPVGFVIYLVFGFSSLPKHRCEDQATLSEQISELIKNSTLGKQINPPAKYRELVALAETLTHLPLFAKNHLEPITGYQAAIDTLVTDINEARYYVHLEYYIIALDETTEPVIKALERAAKRGVTVRVLYDWYGTLKFKRRRELLKRLQHSGISVASMLPPTWPGRNYVRPDLRNHRKIAVIDGVISHTGSLNLIARNYHRRDNLVYDELTLRLVGPITLQLEGIFTTDWFVETGELIKDYNLTRRFDKTKYRESTAHVIPSGPGYDYDNNLKIITAALYHARQSITIVNPYLVPEESLSQALISAAQRGITVTVINSEIKDQLLVAHAQRSYYEALLKAGVKIYLYRSPVLLHSKYLLIDDDMALVGSSNMDIRSFQLNHELSVITYDKNVVAQLQTITDNYLRRTIFLDKNIWLSRPAHKKLLDNIARLTSSIQ